MAITQTKVADSNLSAISSTELSQLLQEGIVAGVIGAAAIAVWFLAAAVMAGYFWRHHPNMRIDP